MHIETRHLSKGQRAMATAIALSIKYATQRSIAKSAEISQAYVKEAIAVLEHAKDLADAVLAGTKPLNARTKQRGGTAFYKKQKRCFKTQ
jgi:hypothetical protein